MWPGSDPENGRKKLLPLLSNARHTLEPDIEPRDSNFILRSSGGYYFELDGNVTWDLLQFQEYASQGTGFQRAGEPETARMTPIRVAHCSFEGLIGCSSLLLRQIP